MRGAVMNIIPATHETAAFDSYSRVNNPADFVPQYAARGGYLDQLTAQEIEGQLAAGLALWGIGFAKQFDGKHLVARAKLLGLPLGATIAFDVEAITDDAPALIAKCDACTSDIQNAGYLAMAYFGAGQPLTSDEMSALVVSRYWRAGSLIRDRNNRIAAPERGWCLLQYAPQEVQHGVMIDRDRILRDYRGDVMTLITA
jgi:hypothetical protein